MDLSELQSTPSTAKQQSFLVNAHGDPLKINLQAVELEGRPKLVRTLKVGQTCPHVYPVFTISSIPPRVLAHSF